MGAVKKLLQEFVEAMYPVKSHDRIVERLLNGDKKLEKKFWKWAKKGGKLVYKDESEMICEYCGKQAVTIQDNSKPICDDCISKHMD